MATGQAVENPRSFLLTTEIFELPNLDIYGQMVCVVLQSYTSESTIPTIDQIASRGRMTPKQATRALQSLAAHKILPQKLFHEILGEFSDDRLSWAAKGILAYCKAHPQANFIELMDLCSQSGESEQTLRNILRELSRHGYLETYAELKKAVG